MHENVSITKSTFGQWRTCFVHDTVTLRSEVGSVLFCLGGFCGYISYTTLRTLKESEFIAVALPAHTSHRTQPLDVSVFSPMKTHVRNAFNNRLLALCDEQRNGVFNICGILHDSYNSALSYNNIVNGFVNCGL